MSDGHIVLNVHMEAVPGREEDLARELHALIAPTRQEPGCLAYELHRDPDAPGRFMFYEKFADQAALDAHIGSAHFCKWQQYQKAGPDPVAVIQVTRWRRME
jgi:quinol monooxygenase YgiN